MASAKMNLVCNECGKRFKVSPSNPDPSCPNCGGVDHDVESVSFYRPVKPVCPMAEVR
jgi:rRNA maturation endonuclease Nob1